MTDKHITVDSIRWHSVLPCLHLLRAAQLALRGRVLLLALLTVFVFSIGQLALWELPFHSNFSRPKSLNSVLQVVDRDGYRQPDRRNRIIWLPDFGIANGRLVWPWLTVIEPASELFRGKTNSWSKVASSWTDLLWSLVVWGVFGGAICRLHAVRFARDQSLSPRLSLCFTARLWQSYVYGPFLPFLGIGALTLVGAMVGRFDAWLTGGHGTILFLLGWLPILVGLLIAFLLLLVAASWPLIVVAVSVEGSDGFDGLSRAFGYVMNRIWYFLSLMVVATFIGLLLDSFLRGFLGMSFHLADWATGWSSAWSGLDRQHEGLGAWQAFLGVFHFCVLVSYFWSAMTVIYFLLRKSDDGTPLDQVYIPGPPPKPEPLPLVGVAASQQPVIERPVSEPVATSAPTVVPENP